MKVKGLDNKQYVLELLHQNSERLCSSYHDNARVLIKKLFPTDKVWEEVTLPGTKPAIYADFMIPLRKMIVEVHGEQHYQWIPHFHPTKKEFLHAQKLDRDKQLWCRLNNFTYIELPCSENINEWRQRIINFGQ